MVSLRYFCVLLQGSENPERLVYKLSWIGSEGRPGTLIIEQGNIVSRLPPDLPKDSRKADLMVVKFITFSE